MITINLITDRVVEVMICLTKQSRRKITLRDHLSCTIIHIYAFPSRTTCDLHVYENTCSAIDCGGYFESFLQKSYNINEINQDYKTLVISEHNSLEESKVFTSTLAIYANLAHHEEYCCEFVLRDYCPALRGFWSRFGGCLFPYLL